MTQNVRGHFINSEEGAGTAFALFVFMVLCVLLGVMIDTTNAWRNRTMLAAAADIGSHAGAVALANGASEDEALQAARALVAQNLPITTYGNTVQSDGDVYLLHFDTDTRQLYEDGPRNAVAVRSNQLASRGNAVGTFLLDFAGVFSWDVREVSVAVFDVSANCLGTDGLYSKGQIRISSQGYVGSGYCLHSNDHVWLPQQVTFEPDTMVSMPDLDDCKNKCNTDANPGIQTGEFPMIFPEFGDYIQGTYDAFNTNGLDDETKAEFFKDRSLGDLSELISAGIVSAVSPPLKGAVVNMSVAEFQVIENLPSGLVYNVTCSAKGGGKNTNLTFSGSAGKMRDAALLTNCALDFEDGSVVEGSLIITTRISSSATVSASSDVTIGDTSVGECRAEDRTTIMSLSGVSVPAKLGASNVTLVVDDTVDIASASSSGDTSYGFTIYATNEIDIAAQHTFISCGYTGDIFLPRGKLIRHVATN